MVYAQIDAQGNCVGISELSGEINADNLIEIESFDNDYLNKQYVNGAWVDKPMPQPTTDEQISALKSQLDEIDRQCVRPLRAIATGTATDFDNQKLADLEAQAEVIRNQINQLKSEEE